MNRRRLLVPLVILGLLSGLVGRVPVAKAISSMPTGWYAIVSAYPGNPGALDLTIWPSGVNEGFDCPSLIYYVEEYSYTGPALEPHVQNNGPNHGVQYTIVWNKTYGEALPQGQYSVSFYIETNMGIVQGTVPITFTGPFVSVRDPIAPDVYPWSALPLTVEITGPASVDTTDTNMWTAIAAGGTTPYTYLWGVTGKTPFWTGMKTGATLTSVVPMGVWPLQVTVMDADGTTATAYLTVTASEIAGSYQAHLQRSGPLGQYMSINVTDAAGDPVTISSTSGTQYGLYEAGGAFGWYAADTEAAQYITYTWRWNMSYTITPPGLAIKPPPDFWFQSSVHLAIPNLNLLVSHHFTGINEHVDPWFPPGPPGTDVPPVIPETPPTPASTLPDWLTPLWDFLVKLFKALFQPDATEFGKQLAGSWVTIASPVPSITPQYTIPFPNPSHLLAPTGDSVNIDFSGIMSYSGYSTYKLIVQVLLDAILVFVVISIIT
jgi:hypothetical protein